MLFEVFRECRENYEEIVEYITLASKTGTPFVRVLGDLEPEPQGEVDDNVVIEALKKTCPHCGRKRV